MRKHLGMLGFMAAALAMSGSATPATKQDAIVVNEFSKLPVADVGRFIGTGARNPYKRHKKIKNQRQYRKHLRSNPHIRNSKKCRV